MNTRLLSRASGFIRREMVKENAYLLPIRIFIGTGWIRAGLEKFLDSGWPTGTALLNFFNQQLTGGHVIFPFYQQLISQVFAPHAMGLSWLIMIGQILVGITVLTGTFTNFALLCGLFMNFNFILAGAVTPSAFYVVIQIALLVANSGRILGGDALLARYVPIGLLVAQPFFTRKFWAFERIVFLFVTIFSAVTAVMAIPFIKDYSPHSVEDPAMIMLVLSMVTGMSALITYFKFHKGTAAIYDANPRPRKV